MNRDVVNGITVLIAGTVISGCSVRDVRDVVVNSAMPPGTAHVMRDVARTAEEIEAEESAERVEELNTEYEDFMRRDPLATESDDKVEHSSIMVDPQGRY